jgi:hypothetical protein
MKYMNIYKFKKKTGFLAVKGGGVFSEQKMKGF